jgi:hypothetical protein
MRGAESAARLRRVKREGGLWADEAAAALFFTFVDTGCGLGASWVNQSCSNNLRHPVRVAGRACFWPHSSIGSPPLYLFNTHDPILSHCPAS